MARSVLRIFEAVAERRITAADGARLLEERRGLVLRLGRLRIQIGGEGWRCFTWTFEEDDNPHWSTLADAAEVLGLVTEPATTKAGNAARARSWLARWRALLGEEEGR